MPGMNRDTGRIMDDMDHIGQSIQVILSTRLGERVMREWFGAPANRIIGENMTQPEIMRWWMVIYTALTLFEPRFVPRGLRVERAERSGNLEIVLLGEFRPYAHLTFQQAQFYIVVTSSGVVVRRAS
jgi:uncharacterized protein